MQTNMETERMDRPSHAELAISAIDRCLMEETTALEGLIRVSDQNGGMTPDQVESHIRSFHERLGHGEVH